MAVAFHYVGLGADGKEVRGRIEAPSRREVARALQQRSIFVVEIREGGGPAQPDGPARARLLPRLPLRDLLPVGPDDQVFFFRQLGLMLRAGHTVVKALDISVGLTSKPRMARAIERMSRAIQGGANFHSAMALEKKTFPPLVANLVASGEASGELDVVLERIASNMERSQEMKRQLITAMIYPSIVLIASIGVVWALLALVVPKFSTFFASRGADLPAMTRMLVDLSAWVVDYGAYAAATVGSVVFLILAASTFERGKAAIDRTLLHLPVFGHSVILSNMAQMGTTMALLIRSGLTVLETLRVLEKVLPNSALAASIRRAGEGILAGQSLSAAMKQKFVPPLMCHMAAVGEQGGQLDAVMDEVGSFYFKRLETRAKRMVSFVEPALIIFVGGIVGVVYLAIFQAVSAVSSI